MVRMLRAAAVLFLVSAAGCASAGTPSPNVTAQVGTAARSELDSTVRQMLQRWQYVLQREALETSLMYETGWRARQPFDDEQALGARAAESRIIVRARPRSREANIYTVAMTVENRLQLADGSWTTPAATSEFSRYARDLARQLEQELVQGIRVR